MEQVLSSYSAIIVAFVAGLFTFLGLLIAKENKVSEFRQAWIDALRAEVAKFVAAVSFVTQAQARWSEKAGQLVWTEFLKLIGPALDSATSAQAAILLRLSLHDGNAATQALIDAIKEIRKAGNEERYEDAQRLAFELHTIAAPVLEREWRRVKSGEPFYLISKWVAATLVALSLVGAIAYWARTPQPTGPYPLTKQSLPGETPKTAAP